MNASNAPGKEIAVIGGGVAGIVACHILQRKHRVTLLEKNDYVGGHTRTVEIPSGPDAGTGVDVGFIVANDRTYPLFKRFIAQLGVSLRSSDMSFGFHCEITGLQFASCSLNSIFAQRGNLLRPRFLGMLRDILRFNRIGLADLTTATLGEATLGDFLCRHRFGRPFIDWYLTPMAAAIWSCPPEQVLQFPAIAFLRFFENHGLLTVNHQPTWETVVGGSHAYVKAFAQRFSGAVQTNAVIAGVRRTNNKAIVRFANGTERAFDAVVLAAHADESLRLLDDPSAEEQKLLGAWRYQHNQVVLHHDASVLPPCPRAWASWNYTRTKLNDGTAPVSVTYDMNRLQGLKTQRQYCVTLNGARPIPNDRVIRRFEFTHPVYTLDSLATQAPLRLMNGTRQTYYCGSYFGYGFHEDAVRSAVDVASRFGLDL